MYIIHCIMITGTIQLFMARWKPVTINNQSQSRFRGNSPSDFPATPTSNLPSLIWSSHDESSVSYEGDTPWKASFLTRNSKREGKHRSAVLRRPVSLGLPHCCKEKTGKTGAWNQIAYRPTSEMRFSRWLPVSIFLNKTHQTYSQFSSIVGFRIG